MPDAQGFCRATGAKMGYGGVGTTTYAMPGTVFENAPETIHILSHHQETKKKTI
jgi:hypothetical protein